MFMASLEVADREAIDGRLCLRRLLDLLFQLRAAECLHNYAHSVEPFDVHLRGTTRGSEKIRKAVCADSGDSRISVRATSIVFIISTGTIVHSVLTTPATTARAHVGNLLHHDILHASNRL